MRIRSSRKSDNAEAAAGLHRPEEKGSTAEGVSTAGSIEKQAASLAPGFPTLPVAKADVSCPRCQSDLVRRVPRRGLVERLLSRAFVYPFRCQLCSVRFKSMRWGIRYNRAPVDRREFERLSVNMPVRVEHLGRGSVFDLCDISMGGAGVEMPDPPARGEVLTMMLYPQGLDRDPISVEAAVVRSSRANFAGFEFLRMANADHEELSHFIWAELMKAMGHLPLKPKRLGLRIATAVSERG